MQARHGSCGKTWSGANREHCPVCCETFNSHGAGDMHRVGDHQTDRRCLSVEEMAKRGMKISGSGYWTTGAEFDREIFGV